jgi:hypothetical protein
MSKNLPGSGGGGGHSVTVEWARTCPESQEEREEHILYSGIIKNLPTKWRRGRRRFMCSVIWGKDCRKLS